MSLAVFPADQLPGLAFPVVKTPMWSTNVQTSWSQRRFRIAKQALPLWKWSLPFDHLKGDASEELQTLVGFYNARQGGFDEFLFDDPDDDAAAEQEIGAGDGVTTQFPLVRTLGGFSEPVGAVKAVSSVKIDAVPTAAYALSAVNGYAGHNAITFTAAPAAGKLITVDFTYYWRVRFLEDSYDFEKFAYQLWSQGAITFESVR